MIFLIAYDRREQRLLREVETFDDSRRAEAYKRRLEVELAFPREEARYEVVLLEATSREAIEVTHARYFHDIPALVRDAKADLKSMKHRFEAERKKRPAS